MFLYQLQQYALVIYSRVVVAASEEETTRAADDRRSAIGDAIHKFFVANDRQDSLFDPVQADPDCMEAEGGAESSCYEPPVSTVMTDSSETRQSASIDAITCSYGGDDPDTIFHDNSQKQQEPTCSVKQQQQAPFDKHWGSDASILNMRDTLRQSGSGASTHNKRPPIFLMPGLASTRLVAWRYKSCPQHAVLSDIKVQDYVWLNINLVLQMSSISIDCFKECLSLGWNQTDTDDIETGCKLRPDEGLDAISSLSPGGIGSSMLIGGTNTVYAWLIQWLADNLGYDVSNIGMS